MKVDSTDEQYDAIRRLATKATWLGRAFLNAHAGRHALAATNLGQ